MFVSPSRLNLGIGEHIYQGGSVAKVNPGQAQKPMDQGKYRRNINTLASPAGSLARAESYLTKIASAKRTLIDSHTKNLQADSFGYEYNTRFL